MRILHLLYDHPDNPWVGGGGAVRAREINRRLAERGEAEIEMVCGAFPGAQDVRTPGFLTRFIGRRRPYPLSRWSYSRHAGRLLAEGLHDVAVVDFSAYTPIRLTRPTAAPVVAVVHHVTGTEARDRWGRLLGGLLDRHEARRLNGFRWISADSRHTLEAVRARVGSGADLRLIGNAVEPALFDLERAPASLPFLLYLGRLDLFHKGLDVLVEAFSRLADGRPEVELRIAGRGKDAERLAEMVSRFPAAGRIHLLGAVEESEKRALLSTAAAVVMPSRMEGWGMVAAEAMAAGAPLVASTAGSLPEVAGKHALFVPPGDRDALVACIEDLLDDPAGRERRAAAGREEARRRFSWDAIADEHLDFLRHVVSSTES